jgi:acyl-coenzyme A synthetase/AMP-(fatty) acid ligase
MLKVGGVYVSPLQVENVLLQHHDRGKVLRRLLR